VWVDPARYAELVDAVERAFSAADPGGSATYARNTAAYRAKVLALDAQFDRALKDCRTRTLVTSHAAFGYLADRYGLAQAPIAGISPGDEPDPSSLAATAREAKADGVRTVLFETLVPRKLADTVARGIGARSDALDPVEGLTREQLDAGESYLTIQRDNLRRLSRGLQCTA
jgi:zinc transport system substrate-binding protein